MPSLRENAMYKETLDLIDMMNHIYERKGVSAPESLDALNEIVDDLGRIPDSDLCDMMGGFNDTHAVIQQSALTATDACQIGIEAIDDKAVRGAALQAGLPRMVNSLAEKVAGASLDDYIRIANAARKAAPDTYAMVSHYMDQGYLGQSGMLTSEEMTLAEGAEFLQESVARLSRLGLTESNPVNSDRAFDVLSTRIIKEPGDNGGVALAGHYDMTDISDFDASKSRILPQNRRLASDERSTTLTFPRDEGDVTLTANCSLTDERLILDFGDQGDGEGPALTDQEVVMALRKAFYAGLPDANIKPLHAPLEPECLDAMLEEAKRNPKASDPLIQIVLAGMEDNFAEHFPDYFEDKEQAMAMSQTPDAPEYLDTAHQGVSL